MIAVLGPTAAGKTRVAIELAAMLDADIISVDSMQVYRRMDIGTAKPTILERGGIPHHMIDVADPSEEFSVAEFRTMGQDLLKARSGQSTVIAGGSGLHFRALVDPMSFAPTVPTVREMLEDRDLVGLVTDLESVDPEAGRHVALRNKRRVVRALEIYQLTGETPSSRAASAAASMIRRYEPEIEFDAFGIDPGEEIDRLIRTRLDSMRTGGLVDEVKALAPILGRTARAAVGYREVLDALDGKFTMDAAFKRIEANTRKLTRRQRTWFQRDPRIQWIPWSVEPSVLAKRIMEIIQ